ncbi:GPI mannosyltransferase 3 [Coccinella septempunctata]|uniref:GPI mannosyltransferase 3 n=1 Tax=Coccinella septempunctata TaxID=41139 RepID=UPI001D0704BE|nr:GPI mannosyltransferase 3 [Coccinella septempunctata]
MALRFEAFGVPLVFLALRIASVFFVRTFYEADEYWQSLEVAHKFVFGYGYLTWEWEKGIRSYVYPVFFTILYKLLAILQLDTATLIILLPRILQAILTAYSDICFYEWTGRRKWAVFCIATSWFSFYMGSRTLINSFETAISTIALSLFPWPGTGKDEKLHFLWLVGFICIVRPTAAVMWFPLCIYHFHITKHSWSFLILTKYIPIGTLLLMASTVLDSLAQKSFVITFYEFFKYNIIKNVATSYGTLPWYWYMSFGLPAILGVHLMPFLISSLVVLKNRKIHQNELVLLGTIVFTVGVFSYLPHKEFRFLMPLLPLVLYITSRYLAVWSRKVKTLNLVAVAFILFIGNAVPAYYLGMVHQRGSLDIMPHLREIAQKDPSNTSFLFLMPCHSTPMYSHLHINVTTRFLTCNPNFNGAEIKDDEVTEFYNSPNKWLRQHYPPNGTLPSHIITFNSLVPRISDILSRYKTIVDVFHTEVPLSSEFGTRILVHELQF